MVEYINKGFLYDIGAHSEHNMRSAGGLPARPAKRRHSRCLACGVLRVVEACGMQQRFQNQNQNWNRVQKEISRKLELIRTTLIFD